MMFIILFAFSTLLTSRAYCPADLPLTSVPQQSTRVQTRAKSTLSDIARKEIIDVLMTGQTKENGEFESVLKNLLIWNISKPMSDNDLALFTSAVIARRENPRHQSGIDMISDLLARVENTSKPRPYLILTLCNARAVTHKHLDEMIKYSAHRTNYTHLRDLELNALILKTLACAATLPDAHKRKLDVFTDCMQQKAENIRSSMSNGYIDNIYSTSLAVMALTAYNRIDPDFQWKKKEAMESLRKELTSGSVTKIYYITMALNAHRVPFLKDLHKQPYETHMTVKRDIRVTLSLQNEGSEYFAVQLKVPGNWNLLEIMFKASNFSTRFRFTYIDYQGFSLLEVDDTPNDPERGLYWTIYKESNKNCNKSLDPTSHIPNDGDNITLAYESTTEDGICL